MILPAPNPQAICLSCRWTGPAYNLKNFMYTPTGERSPVTLRCCPVCHSTAVKTHGETNQEEEE